MNELLPQILEIVQPAALTLIEGALGILVPLILWKANAWLKTKVHSSSFSCAMDKVTSITEAAVLTISQAYVKGVRKSGQWNGATASAAKDMALSLAKDRLGPAGLKELMGCLGHDKDGVSEVLSGAIESAVVRFKNKHALPTGGHENAEPMTKVADGSER